MRKQIELKELQIKTVQVAIEGTAPLITHAFPHKIRLEIEAKQQGKSKTSKHEIRIPEEEFEQAKHISPLGWEGFPANGFKQAIVRGAKMTGLVMKDTQMALFVIPDCPESQLVKIDYEICRMRVDPVRLPSTGTADIRYRPEYTNWKATLTIKYNEGVISLEQVIQCILAAGFGCGIGEWRPEKGGSSGTFKLAQ